MGPLEKRLRDVLAGLGEIVENVKAHGLPDTTVNRSLLLQVLNAAMSLEDTVADADEAL